jgi:electron-transferring-flavoprotein dehydrogenase
MSERAAIHTDIVCVGFGPATGGFLTTVASAVSNDPSLMSRVMEGQPLQVLCYERADDLAFGVSGVVSRARGILKSLPDINWSEIPLAAPITSEKLAYLLDPHGASKRSLALRIADKGIRACRRFLPYEHEALELPYIPPFLRKHGGAVFSLGQFNQWVGMRLLGTGAVQIWPGMPVGEALIEGERVTGVRLVDQGTAANGQPEANYMPGMDIKAKLTVVGDGPVGAVGRQLDAKFGLPPGHAKHEWALGMKMLVSLPEGTPLKPGTVFHTFGYPEPEIFGFLYVYANNLASLGIFVPSWFDNPVRTVYRYLQHWMTHPYLWRYLEGGTLRSWGAKSLLEAGRHGEPYLCGDGFARIGEGSGTTNVLTGSGVDEAWTSGVILGEAVLELLKNGAEFSRENLDAAYVSRRRKSGLETELRTAEHARDGFRRGAVTGFIGMALSGYTRGLLAIPAKEKAPYERLRSLEDYFSPKLAPEDIKHIQLRCKASAQPLHDALMDACGWPNIAFDGKLLMSHQDALLLGGKVQAQSGYANHVEFLHPELCRNCGTQICVDMCSGQAITRSTEGGVGFDREKCVHCGACVWNCAEAVADGSLQTNIEFKAGSGGLHSAEN